MRDCNSTSDVSLQPLDWTANFKSLFRERTLGTIEIHADLKSIWMRLANQRESPPNQGHCFRKVVPLEFQMNEYGRILPDLIAFASHLHTAWLSKSTHH